MTVVEVVRRKVDSRLLTCRCEAGKCSVSLAGIEGQFVVIEVDVQGDPHWSLASKGRERCDYLLVGDADTRGNLWVVPLELTTYKDKGPQKIVGQLQMGARIADRLIPKESTVRFCPVLASLNLRRHIRVQLGKKWVKFRGKRARVVEINCGQRLTEALRG